MENVGYLLGDRSRLLRRAFDDQVRPLGLTGPQARLLLHLQREEGGNQGFYADRLDVQPITLCRMVDRMEDSGMIERRPDPDDRRARQLYLTPRSRALIAELRGTVDTLLEDMLAGVSAHDREIFIKLLTRIGENLTARRADKVPSHG